MAQENRATTQPIDLAALMPKVAQRLLGDPNNRLSRGSRLRFGNKGSMEIDVADGWFDDHEANVRGGVLDLIRHRERCDVAGAFRWLEAQGLKNVDQPAARVRGNLADAVHRPEPPRSDARTFYDYCDEDGATLFRIERRGKDAVPPFLQHGPDGNGGFHAARGCMQGVRRVPYRLPEILAADPSEIVFVCEGEKDADRLTAAGLVATTNPGGAGKFTADQAAALKDRRVIALQDNDEAGATHVAAVLAVLDGVATSAAALLLPGLPAKGDVFDWLAQGGSAFELKRLAEAALHKPTEIFPIADLTAWAEVDPKPKTFRMAGYVPEQEVTIFPGPGGVGKSTFALQLCACSAAGKPMLGIDVEPGAALYVTAEDDDRENHWRLRKIATAIGTTLRDLAGKLHIVSLRGKLNNELATFDNEGRLRPAPAYALLRATIAATKAKLIVLDNVGHLYVGNENDRGQVTGFINLLYQLCRELGVTVVLIAHPNKAGDSYSGSTAWLNAVRSQIVLQRPEDSHDPDARVLTLGKANYARPDQQLTFRWHDFALILDKDLPDDRRAEVAAIIHANTENAAFMNCLAERVKQGEGRQVGPNTGPNYAPTQFEGMAQAKGLKRDRLKSAMDRLFTIGAIETHTYRNTTKGRDVTIIRAVAGDPERPPRTLPEHVPQTPPNSTPEHLTPHTPPLKGGTGAAFGGLAPAPDQAPDQPISGTTRTASRMILAPGETGDEPIPGWDDLNG